MSVTITNIQDLTAAQERRRYVVIYREVNRICIYHDSRNVYKFSYNRAHILAKRLVSEASATILHILEVPNEH